MVVHIRRYLIQNFGNAYDFFNIKFCKKIKVQNLRN